jgi:hypothetical protein
MSNLDGDMEHELNALLRKHAVKQYECNHCMQPITFKDRIPYNDDGSEHRCLSSRGMPCNRCGASVNFKDRKPINLDGSAHRCIAEARAAMRQRDSMDFDPLTGELFDTRGQHG